MQLTFTVEEWARLLVAPYDQLVAHEKVAAERVARGMGAGDTPRDLAAIFTNWAALPGSGPVGYASEAIAAIRRAVPGQGPWLDLAEERWQADIASGRAGYDPRVRAYTGARDRMNTERALVLERQVSTIADWLGVPPSEVQLVAMHGEPVLLLWRHEDRRFCVLSPREREVYLRNRLEHDLSRTLAAPDAVHHFTGIPLARLTELRQIRAENKIAVHQEIARALIREEASAWRFFNAVVAELTPADVTRVILDGIALSGEDTDVNGWVLTEITEMDDAFYERGYGIKSDGTMTQGVDTDGEEEDGDEDDESEMWKRA